MHHPTTHDRKVVGIDTPGPIQQTGAGVRSCPALGAIQTLYLDIPTEIMFDWDQYKIPVVFIEWFNVYVEIHLLSRIRRGSNVALLV